MYKLVVLCLLPVETFLELLEPYILKDMLGSLPPGVSLILHLSVSLFFYLFASNSCA